MIYIINDRFSDLTHNQFLVETSQTLLCTMLSVWPQKYYTNVSGLFHTF